MLDDSYVQPTKGRVKFCAINGANLVRYVHCLRLYESVCKPYLTAELIIMDNNDLIENLGIKGGDSVTVSFDAPPNASTYTADLYIVSLQGRQSPENLKTQIYTFNLIGPTYFQDKKEMVNEMFKGVTGTSAIQKIWGKHLNMDSLNILVESIGMLGDKEGFKIENQKPFTAIDNIRRHLIFPGYAAGSSLLFRNRTNAVLSPLERLFDEPIQEFFIQKETWGVNFRDPNIYRSIIVAHLEVAKGTAEGGGPGRGGGRGGATETSQMGAQQQQVFDMFKSVMHKNTGTQSLAGGLSGIFGGGQGGMGGVPNVQMFNSFLSQPATASFNKTMKERMYSARVRNGPQLTIKVPLQTGINVTVGKRINALLMPPTGDLAGNAFGNPMSGAWLVKDLMHEIYNDKREVNATSVIQTLKGVSYG